jgi:hypothetical protein
MIDCIGVKTAIENTEVNPASAIVSKMHNCDCDFFTTKFDALINVVTNISANNFNMLLNENTFKIIDLTDDGTTTGNRNLNIDGSIIPKTYFYKPPVGKRLISGRLTFYMASGITFSDEKFGSISTLPNGLSVKVNGTEIVNWKTNIDINLSMYDNESPTAYGVDKKSMTGRWTFTNTVNGVRGIEILETDGFEIVVRDDLTGLDFLMVSLHGQLEDI